MKNIKSIVLGLVASLKNNASLLLAFALVLAMTGIAGATGSDVQSIVDSANTTFSSVATACVTIGVFFIGYRLAKRIR